MNAAERQVLRDKHHIDWDALYGSMTMCVECYELYPCDVVQLLDAWDTERAWVAEYTNDGFVHERMTAELVSKIPDENCTQIGTINDCDHLEIVWVADNYVRTLTETPCAYCPKCGATL